ncbi:MAG: portal protein [Rhodomicrobium sp.]
MADDSDIIDEAQERLNAAWTQDRENREDAFMDLKFLAGDQWPQAIRLQREATNRPCLTINRLPQFVNQVANDVRKNPPGIKAIPAGGPATQEIAEIYTGLFRQIQARSNAAHVFCQAAYYAVACGIGHFRLTTEYADDDSFDQEIFIRRIQHPLSVFWDPDAIEPDRSDANYCLVSELIQRDAFKKRFPDASEADFAVPSDLNAETGLFWATRDAVRLAEYWRKVPEERTLGRTDTGEVLDLTKVSKASLRGVQVVAERKVKSYKIERYLLSGTEVLEGPTEWAGRFIPIFPVIGSEVALESKTIRHGLVRFSMDPQQLYNYSRSAAAEVIALQPRAPFLATPNMIAKYKGQWDTHNTNARPYLLYDPDPEAPGGRPMREPPPAMAQAFVEEAKIASEEIQSTTGIYNSSLGARSNEVSGVAIHARESQGDTSTLHFQDNLVATLHHLGRAMIDLVPKIYDSQRIIRVLQEDGEEQQPVHINVPVMTLDGKPLLLNDLSQGIYDVRVKIGPAYQTRRAEAADSMLQFIQAVPQAAQVIGDLIAKSMDWPGAEAIAERLEKMLPPQISGNPPPPEAQQAQAMQQQVQMGMAQAKIAETQGRAQKAQAEAVRTHVETQLMASGGQAAPPMPSPQEAHAAAMQEVALGREASLKNALLEASVQERQARANKAEVDLQGGIMKNDITRARFMQGDRGFSSNL